MSTLFEWAIGCIVVVGGIIVLSAAAPADPAALTSSLLDMFNAISVGLAGVLLALGAGRVLRVARNGGGF